MKTMIEFTRAMMRMPPGWVAWVGVLSLTNMVAPLFFLPRIEAILILAATMAGAVTQMLIFQRKGFVRLLGVGHFYWIPVIGWIVTRFDVLAPSGAFEIWLAAVIAIDVVSLLIDVTDVARYLLGERRPTLPGPAAA